MDWKVFVEVLFGALLLVATVRVLMAPIKLVLRLVLNSVAGLLLLWIVNLGSQLLQFHLGLNPVTALTAGLLGIPGVILLVVLRVFLH